MTRTGIGYDVHAVAAGRKLMLGCVHFDDAKVGLAGHSDADVVAHAICDAILGAAALGDIGEHFPNTEAEWKDAESKEFLIKVAGMVRELGYDIINVDCTVLSDAVKLGDRKRDMVAAIAGYLDVAPNCVNVKATTFEGKGAIGRGEAIACEAIATLERGAAPKLSEWREDVL
ncbi:MAG TPA: 2-C-methyl-D-erythritol 2,4-cyclodiphosphate synthase [Candidatus Krumholzibacteria bacterium]|nr:2-C-methyl-D-erythritol 2,4-cyclodiphosphate synthase [Candidatus Krumholzibacteria bacterium]